MSQANTKPAAVLAGAAANGQTQQYLTFVLAGETFAMGILAIKEIIEYATLTEVPMMPRYVRGVINLRGAVVPVIDLPLRFGKPSSQVTKRTCIVIVEIVSRARQAHEAAERHVVGVVVDAVNAVLDIPASEIEPPPAFGASIRTDFIQGMGKVNGRFVILLNVDHVLAADEMQVLTEAQETASNEAV
ncbi:MAG TPA: chemotaxis protein CheW [Steroidobacteraceae bacterium]